MSISPKTEILVLVTFLITESPTTHSQFKRGELFMVHIFRSLSLSMREGPALKESYSPQVARKHREQGKYPGERRNLLRQPVATCFLPPPTRPQVLTASWL